MDEATMNDMWAVRLQPTGATNSVSEGGRAAHVLAQKMAVTDGTTAAEVLHLEDGGWVMRCRYTPEQFDAAGNLRPMSDWLAGLDSNKKR